MYGTIIFDDSSIDSLELDSYVLKLLRDAHIATTGDLQRALINDRPIYYIGPKRRAYLRQKLRDHGLIASRPWTVCLHRVLFSSSEGYPVITKRGEKELSGKLLHWLHDEKPFAHPENVDPAFIFFGRIGIGRISRSQPNRFNDYDGYVLIENDDGRYDDAVQKSGQLARICNVEVGEINVVYQKCLALLRGEPYREEILRIYRDYAENRRC